MHDQICTATLPLAHRALRPRGGVGIPINLAAYASFLFLIGDELYQLALAFTWEPIHNQPLLFVGILFIIFGFQFILIGLLAEMIQHYAFQRGEEYSVRQELELCNDSTAQDVFFPTELHKPQGQRYTGGLRLHSLFPQSSQDWKQELQPLENKRNGSKNYNSDRVIPRRPTRSTIIPL